MDGVYLFRRPCSVARRLRESSDSLLRRTAPESANETYSPVATPLAFTLATLICTEAWSLAVMRRLVAELAGRNELP